MVLEVVPQCNLCVVCDFILSDETFVGGVLTMSDEALYITW